MHFWGAFDKGMNTMQKDMSKMQTQVAGAEDTLGKLKDGKLKGYVTKAPGVTIVTTDGLQNMLNIGGIAGDIGKGAAHGAIDALGHSFVVL